MSSVDLAYTIAFNQKIRIGYRVWGSSGPYTYLNTFPGPGDSPYDLTSVLTTGDWDVEVTVICPNCSGNSYSSPTVTSITVP